MYPRPTLSGTAAADRAAPGAPPRPAAAAGAPVAHPAPTTATTSRMTRPTTGLRRREDIRPPGLADANEAAFEDDDDEVEGDPEQRDRDEGREHQRDVEEAAARQVHEEPESLLRTGPLADD